MDQGRTELGQALKQRREDLILSEPAALAIGAFISQSTAKLATHNITPDEHNREITLLALNQREINSFTGMFNKEGFKSQLKAAVEIAKETGVPLTLLILDGDNFGLINKDPKLGFAVGDRVIFATGKAVKQGARREGDIKAQIEEDASDPSRPASNQGGDEYAVILLGTDSAGAEVVASRIKELVGIIVDEEVPEYRNRFGKRLTVSVGIAQYAPDSDDAKSLADRADKAMQAEKRLKKFGNIPVPDLSDLEAMEDWIGKWVKIPPLAEGSSADPDQQLNQERRTLMYFVQYADKNPQVQEEVLGILIKAATRKAPLQNKAHNQ